ncbi:MAG: Holliday junction branch migration protein RuvA [Candidatus Goldiibacteriota bacterium]
MIDFLEGTIEEITEKYLLLNVNGTGYGITITAAAYDRLRRENGIARVYTYMSVSDSGVALYGFSNREEKDVFLALISVEGIGPKAGTNILSSINPDSLRKAIASGNEAALTRVPGLGPKKAQRMIVELKDKFKMFAHGEEEFTPDEEYLQALLALGFNYQKSREALRQAVIAAGEKAEKEVIIKEALKRLGK